MLPETSKPDTARGLYTPTQDEDHTIFDAIAIGTQDGLRLALAVGAMLIASVALISCANGILGWVSFALQSVTDFAGLGWKIPSLSLQSIFGFAFAPIGWLLGLEGDEVFRAGELLGIKVAINEIIAHTAMVGTKSCEAGQLHYLLSPCAGSANFSSIGLQIAGIGALAPEQRKTIARLGLRAVLGSTLANLLSAFIAGLMI